MRLIFAPLAAALLVFALPAGHAQPAAAHPTFEVASIKPSPTPASGVYSRTRVRGGPGSSDPTMASFEYVDLVSLVTMAYNVPRYRFSAPAWLATSHFEINARIPPGATLDDYRLMLQDLLVTRFNLAVHQENRTMVTYELVVAKNGPKLKEVPEDPDAAAAGLQPPPFPPSPPPGAAAAGVNLAFPKSSIERLATFLAGVLGAPVVDSTGLKGSYEIRLRIAMGVRTTPSEASEPEPDVYQAVQEQLGLKLVKKNAPVDILVVDHIEKLPTGN